MRLVIDAAGLQSESRRRGIGRYTRGLVTGLARMKGENEIWLVLNRERSESDLDIEAAFSGLIPSSHIVRYRALDEVSFDAPNSEWRRKTSEFAKDHFLASLEPDAILFSSLFEGYAEDIVTCRTELLDGIPCVAIAYDLIPLLSPDIYLGAPVVRSWYMEKIGALRRCDLVLSISQSAGREVIDLLGFAANKVTNISTAADSFASLDVGDLEFRAIASRFGIDAPYFVYNASFEARKNFNGLIKAFALFQLRATSPHKLVLITSDKPEVVAQIDALLRSTNLEPKDVIVTGYVNDAELKLIYSHCVAMVYASKHEGFGLPALEAMHCDAPVIGSDVSSIPEIIGMAEAMFDPDSNESIADLMFRASHEAAFRERLIANSVERRRLFSWDRSARLAWSALQSLPAVRRGADDVVLDGGYRRLIGCVKGLHTETVAPRDGELRELAIRIADNLDNAERIARQRAVGYKTWRIEGPFDSTYSLALLNRETARALDAAGAKVILKSTEGPGDYHPNEEFLRRDHPDILHLWREGARNPIGADIVSRNLYPPRVHDMDAGLRLMHHYAWEESRFPTNWVNSFNEHLDGLTCLSSHVKKVLQDSGVRVPMRVSGCGVDHWERVVPAEGVAFPGRSFRFLHVSSCFPRKGPDVLIEAYGRAFRQSDDVTLVIKTFENPHNEVAALLERARAADPEFPDVVLIFDDLPDSELKALYRHCHTLVAPSRAEGYGLPMAEAMLSGLPVITTGWSGQLDFCTPENSWLVDYDFAPADTHFRLPASVWAEPRIDSLASKMREAFCATQERRTAMANSGRETLLNGQKWSDVVDRLFFAARSFEQTHTGSAPKIGVVTTWNCRCGIAAASEHLFSNFIVAPTIYAPLNDERIGPDSSYVRRCWNKDRDGDMLRMLEFEIERDGIDAVIIQFNYGFFDFLELSGTIHRLKARGLIVVLILHSTSNPAGRPDKSLDLLRDALLAADRVLVHSHHDLNRLKSMGVVQNAAQFPLGVVDGLAPSFRAKGRVFTLSSFGFCLPHKGLLNLVEAFHEMVALDDSLRLDLVNAIYPAPVSVQLAKKIQQLVVARGLEKRATLTTDYLSDSDALIRLSNSDLIVFPYEVTGESASAAVRLGIASGKPVARSKLSIFHDVADITFPVNGENPTVLAESLTPLIRRLRERGDDIAEKEAASEAWRQEHQYRTLAVRLQNIIIAHFEEKRLSMY